MYTSLLVLTFSGTVYVHIVHLVKFIKTLQKNLFHITLYHIFGKQPTH